MHICRLWTTTVKFHKKSISSLVGIALTGYMPHPFRESISLIISPFKFWTATILLHAHLQVVYYKCVKFHKNPISRLGGVALTRYIDGRRGWFLYTPPPANNYPHILCVIVLHNSMHWNASDLTSLLCIFVIRYKGCVRYLIFMDNSLFQNYGSWPKQIMLEVSILPQNILSKSC